MRTLIQLLFIALLAGLAGCETLPCFVGDVDECLPQHVEKCRADTAFFVAKTEKRVKAQLERALRARGFTVVGSAIESDVIVRTTTNSWEYNDAGFSGFRDRVDAVLTIALVDRRKERVLGRWRVTVRSDFRILDRCVDKM